MHKQHYVPERKLAFGAAALKQQHVLQKYRNHLTDQLNHEQPLLYNKTLLINSLEQFHV